MVNVVRVFTPEYSGFVGALVAPLFLGKFFFTPAKVVGLETAGYGTGRRTVVVDWPADDGGDG